MSSNTQFFIFFWSNQVAPISVYSTMSTYDTSIFFKKNYIIISIPFYLNTMLRLKIIYFRFWRDKN